jgi:xanthine dehydrogenase accessory factor
MAQGLDYQVTICDPREEYAEGWNVAGVELKRGMPDEVVTEMNLDGHCAVVTLTHDPKLDDPALEAALRSDAFYIGALGSRKTHASRVARLKTAGFDDAAIARIHGPVGLSINAESPAEIAVSIMAQITAVRRHQPEAGSRDRAA